LRDRRRQRRFRGFLYRGTSESVFLNLVEKRFVTNAEILGGFALVAVICFQSASDLSAFDDAQGSLTLAGEVPPDGHLRLMHRIAASEKISARPTSPSASSSITDTRPFVA